MKDIGEEDGGLYILKPCQLLDIDQHRSFVATLKDSMMVIFGIRD